MPVASVLDLVAIVAALGDQARRFDIDILPICPSTNAELLTRAEIGAPSGTVVATENQTNGRGRRGRPWIAAPGDSLTFSLLWRFPPGATLAGLSLAVGLAVATALEKVDAGGTASAGSAANMGTALKWPNDLLRNGRKLGGILVELVSGAPQAAVIGIGINLHLPETMPADLRSTSSALDRDLDPSTLLAVILRELLTTLEGFVANGFAALRPAWRTRHAFENHAVRLLSDFAPPREGICRGVDDDGALLFETAGGIERILAGEISLRASQA